jgi:hypothetical protein
LDDKCQQIILKIYETRKEQDFVEAILNLPDTFMEYQDDLEIH